VNAIASEFLTGVVFLVLPARKLWYNEDGNSFTSSLMTGATSVAPFFLQFLMYSKVIPDSRIGRLT